MKWGSLSANSTWKHEWSDVARHIRGEFNLTGQETESGEKTATPNIRAE